MLRSLGRRIHHLFSLPQPMPHLPERFRALDTQLTTTDFKTLAENSADVILRVGPDMKANYVSPSARQVLGFEPEELLGRHPTGDFSAGRPADH